MNVVLLPAVAGRECGEYVCVVKSHRFKSGTDAERLFFEFEGTIFPFAEFDLGKELYRVFENWGVEHKYWNEFIVAWRDFLTGQGFIEFVRSEDERDFYKFSDRGRRLKRLKSFNNLFDAELLEAKAETRKNWKRRILGCGGAVWLYRWCCNH